ncbi:MAG: helix-turn-helix domain-containing protein [Planctomycetota bacterium]|nr:helix-turn-helix domain-containing protein [Planctomycetota bacterium]
MMDKTEDRSRAMAQFVSIGKIPKPRPSFPRHAHPDTWELVIYTHGRGTITVGEEPVPFRLGTIVALPPVVPHEERSESGFANIYLHCRGFARFNGRVPVYQDRADRPYFTVASLLLQETGLRRNPRDPVIERLFGVLLDYLAEWGRGADAHPLVEALRGKLAARLHDSEFQVGEALSELPASADHLRKLFRERTGRTPLGYLNELRIGEAKRLLRLGGFSVKEVAHRVGVPDPYYFSRLFLKHAGARPSAYAKDV